MPVDTWLLQEIRYTGTKTELPRNKTIFEYQDRIDQAEKSNDTSESYVRVAKFVTLRNVHTAIMYINWKPNEDSKPADAIKVRSYVFGYSKGVAGRSRISSMRQRKSTVIGGYNKRTGQLDAKACGSGKCAENHVSEALGRNKSFVRFTKRVRTEEARRGFFSQQPVCVRCQGDFDWWQFPGGTKFRDPLE